MNAQAAAPDTSSPVWKDNASPFADLEERLSEVRSLFDSLSRSLELTISEIRGRGLPPNHALVFDVGECHRAFIRLRAELLRRAGSLGLDAPPLERLTDLTDLTHLLDHFQEKTGQADSAIHEPAPISYVAVVDPVSAPVIESNTLESPDVLLASDVWSRPEVLEPIVPDSFTIPSYEPPAPEPEIEVSSVEAVSHEQIREAIAEEPAPYPVSDPAEEIRASALRVLDQVAALQLKDQGEFAPLSACRENARTLREAIADADPHDLPLEAQQLVTGEHPFVSLLIVVAGVGDLSDAQWANHHSLISETFGRPMAVAAARGRLLGPS